MLRQRLSVNTRLNSRKLRRLRCCEPPVRVLANRIRVQGRKGYEITAEGVCEGGRSFGSHYLRAREGNARREWAVVNSSRILEYSLRATPSFLPPREP